MSTFDETSWSEQLAECIANELNVWAPRLEFEVVRALAVDCSPWNVAGQSLSLSVLTEREHAETDREEWAVADWRLFNFTQTANAHWAQAADLDSIARAHFAEASASAKAERRDQLCRACASALRMARVAEALSKLHLSADFQLYAGHADAPKHNFATGAWNPDPRPSGLVLDQVHTRLETDIVAASGETSVVTLKSPDLTAVMAALAALDGVQRTQLWVWREDAELAISEPANRRYLVDATNDEGYACAVDSSQSAAKTKLRQGCDVLEIAGTRLVSVASARAVLATFLASGELSDAVDWDRAD